MNDKFINKHPADKSLSVFPLIPQEKCSLIAFDNLSKNHSRGKNKVRITLRQNRNHEPNELENHRNTKAKLEKAAKHLPYADKTSFQLPPIKGTKKTDRLNFVAGKRQLSNEGKHRGYKAFILPVISREQCKCTCAHNDNEDLPNIKLKHTAKLFRPEETPPLFSVYVRWKNRRNGTMEYTYDSLLEVFQHFGEITNIVFKSRSSAIIVYMQIESACKAAKVMQKVAKDMKLHVKWLNDMSQ